MKAKVNIFIWNWNGDRKHGQIWTFYES